MRYAAVVLVAILLNMPVRGDDVAYTPDAPVSCDAIPAGMYAVYGISQYTCQRGYYLPADSEICRSCPTGGSCIGGTFTLNPNEYQGLVLSNIHGAVNYVCANNFPTNMYAMYQINVYTCSAGYYLPANTDGCTVCPANSYCGGGTYAFNETTAQGITSCPNEYSLSAVGATAQTDCYKTCTTNESPHTTSFIGGNYYGGANTCAPADSNSCDNGYHYVSANGNNLAQCSANEITINWDDGNGGADTTTCTYGGTITTPTTAPTKRGHTFLGWRFVAPSGN